MSQRNGQEWRNAEYLIDILGNYPRKVKVKVNNGTGDQNRIARFDQLIGKWVSVGFDIDAHEYQGRWFNTIRAFRVDRNIQNAAPAAEMPGAPAPAAAPAFNAAPLPEVTPFGEEPAGDGSELPF